MASPHQLDLLSHDKAAGKPGAPDLTAQGSFAAPGEAQAAASKGDMLPVVASSEGDAASEGAVAKASLVHSAGLEHGIAEVMAVSSSPAGGGAGRVLLRRRPADDALAPDTWDVTASAHLKPGEDAATAARRALESAGLASAGGLRPLPGAPERRRLEFPVGGYVENVVVHGYECDVGGGDGEAAAAAAGGASTKGPDGAERAWLAREDAARMLEDDPAVCSPFLAAGKKAWFAA